MNYLYDASPETLVRLCAEKSLSDIAAAWRERRRAQIVITGGRTGYAIAKAIDSDLFKIIRENERFEGSIVHIWMSDERFVPQGDPLRNDDSLISAFSLSKSNILFHRIAGTGESATAASQYSAELESELGSQAFDSVILSMGEDGHIASLFPGQLDHKEKRSAIAVIDSPKPPAERVSLSLSRLANGRSIYVFCLGDSKIEALRAVQSGPVGLLDECSPNSQVNILTDIPVDSL